MSASKPAANERPVRTSVKVIKQRVLNAKAQAPEEDFLAIEDPLQLVLVIQAARTKIEKNLVVTMRTPGHDEALIHGFLYAEGIIQNRADIVSINYEHTKLSAAPTRAKILLREGLDNSAKSCERNFAIHSSCGACGVTRIGHLEIPKALRIEDSTQVDAANIHQMPAQMHNEQATFRQTGGLHAAAIFDKDGVLQVSREDIGRHNALDKAIGKNLLDGRTPKLGKVLCVSGRMSYEIIQKALIARIPIIVGVGAPSSLAVALANDFNITLIGFARKDSYNIYSCPERILSQL